MHLMEKKMIGSSISRFIKGELLTYCLQEERTGLVNLVSAVDNIYLDLTKVFGMVSHSILTSRSHQFGLDKRTLRWVRNW